MANSSVIITLKNNVVNAICQDEDICSLIDSPKYNGDELKNTHIFKYNKNPNTITDSITFITVQVGTVKHNKVKAFVKPKLILTIYTENDHMDVRFGNKIQDANRNDYLSSLIDEKFNGTTEYGSVGRLEIVSNNEGVATDRFMYRQLIFETVDFDMPQCDGW